MKINKKTINSEFLKIINNSKPTSGKKEGIGGIDAFAIKINPKTINTQKWLTLGLILNPSREPVECAISPALLNIPIEAQPWANDNKITIKNISLLNEQIETIIKVIWVILLKATYFLMSDWRKVVILATVASITQILRLQLNKKSILVNKTTRTAPYLPNFSKIPANNIEPEVLASTWAFGSQKWIPKIGILTKNGNNKRTEENVLTNVNPVKKFELGNIIRIKIK